jgi:hypothetical protein
MKAKDAGSSADAVRELCRAISQTMQELRGKNRRRPSDSGVL